MGMFEIMTLLMSMCGSMISSDLFPVGSVWGVSTSCLTGYRGSKDDLGRELTLSRNLFPVVCVHEESISCLTGL